jgi:tetratricopeptide (TPR) repeat protein
MSTVQLGRSSLSDAGQDVRAPVGSQLSGLDEGRGRAPGALMIALLVLVLYAAFAHGADSDPAEARVQVGLSLIAALAGIGWLWTGTLRFRAQTWALAGVSLLLAFAVWSAITLLWSIAPNQTWLEFNRDLAYVLVLALAIGAGASHRRPLEALGIGYVIVALVVTLYALGQKILPGLDIGGLIDLNQTGQFARLQAPLDYWNALALLIVFAVPVALVIAADEERPRRMRIACLLAVELMLLVIVLTYSRGGLLALAVALVVSFALGRGWLRSLALLAAAAVAMVVPLWMALSLHGLSGSGVPLGTREAAGGEFFPVLVVSLAALYFGAGKLLDHETRLQLSPARIRRLLRLLAAGVGLAVVILVIAVAVSSRGLGGTVSHAWHSFTTPHATANVNNPNISLNSTNRWVWWKEAVGAFSDRPAGGWGAGSFEVLDLLYRTTSTLTVEDAHSVPLQWLAETGLVGALLALAGYGLLLAAGLKAVRRKEGLQRAFAAALLAGGVAYAVHAFYDWDWDMPGVTFPVLLFLGVLVGSAAGRRAWDGFPRPNAVRGLALAACTLVLCAYALSALLPSLAATKASAALTAAGTASSRSQLEDAQGTAVLASRLDPLSDGGLTAAASISLALDRPAQARAYLLLAVGRDPSDVNAWKQLANLELGLRDLPATGRAIEHVLALDPRGAPGRQLALELQELRTPPNDSATATSTPLPVTGTAVP